MPTANLRELKPGFLALIDTLREYRLQELGKIGATHIPEERITSLEAPHKLHRMYRALIGDGVLGTFETTEGPMPFAIEEHDGVREMVFDCRKTAEELVAYRTSLVIEGALALQIDTHNGNYYEMYRNGLEQRVQLSDLEGTLLALLIEHANTPMERAEVAQRCDMNVGQVSSALNSIRRKIEKLGFTEDQTRAMLRPYARGEVMFNREA